jgi:hypothetical protein
MNRDIFFTILNTGFITNGYKYGVYNNYKTIEYCNKKDGWSGLRIQRLLYNTH